MNNAHLKLNSMSEFTALWNSGERFQKFAEQVYRYLERMKPGTVLVLERYSGEQLEWIIKTACVFILEGNNSLEYEFNEDYTAVVHRHVDPDVKKWILSVSVSAILPMNPKNKRLVSFALLISLFPYVWKQFPVFF